MDRHSGRKDKDLIVMQILSVLKSNYDVIKIIKLHSF